MGMVLTEEQRLLQENARELFEASAPVETLRKLRDSQDPLGYSADLWRQMVELGWTGITLPEASGGSDFGFFGLGLLMEEAGRCLAASPLLATVAVGASAIMEGGSEEQQQTCLPGIVSGEHTLALALEEGRRHDPAQTALEARRDGDSWLLSGRKVFVLDGHSADTLVVAARTAGSPGQQEGLSLFLLAADSPGISRKRTAMVDSRNAAIIVFSDVKASAVLGKVDSGFSLLERVLDCGRAALAAEMLGGASALLERTVKYLGEREQFGVKIGSFQALQHRAAHMFSELQLTRSSVYAALDALEQNATDTPALVSAAKVRANDTYRLLADESVQMHGGIGMTDELEIGFFLKRAQVSCQTFGDSSFHRSRYADFSGF